MSSFLFSAAKAVGNIAQFVQDSNAPVDMDGARPVPSFLKQEVEDIHQVVTRGAAFSITDLVRPTCLNPRVRRGEIQLELTLDHSPPTSML